MAATQNVEDAAPLTIQEVSRLSGLSEPTLRYYEKIGLIDPVDRDESSGHRRYDPAAVRTIEALGCLRATGMSVQDMRSYLRHLTEGDEEAAQLRDLFQRNADRVAEELERMRIRLRYLRLKADLWDARERADLAAEHRAVDAILPVMRELR
ncbi:MerR family transcriptional regulator [Actinomadura sp. K4S16]|uniref:MerR family transcriptional regulator n=1 Tax=Actinomadura sp. K4S16 TaxID=1316147 RepID=UPI0011F05B93|nr:MerR family transcriptional regulator [Actinomadura sp. K4S16]